MKKISRKKFLKQSTFAGGGLLLSNTVLNNTIGSSVKPDETINNSQHNVLLIISDDHGLDQLGCYGNPVINTPNLDAMATRGVRFTNSYSVAPSCSASRGALLTGLYSHQNGQYGHQHAHHHFTLFDNIETIPSLLRKRGYRTGLIGKLHVESKSNLEFDYRIYGESTMGNRDARKIADYSEKFFNSETNTPFFLMIGYSDPHRSSSNSGESNFSNDQFYDEIYSKKYNPKNVIVPDYLPDIPAVRQELADQYEAVTRMDTSIGWVIEGLMNSNRYKDTLIIYLSDNGIPFPGAKTNMYDSGLRLPMIINLPGINSEKKVCHSMTSYIDILPTILEWTGSPAPPYKLPGESIIPILNGDTSSDKIEVFGSHTFHEITMFYPMRTIKTKNYRYIQNLYPELEFPFATDLYDSKTWQAILKNKTKKMGKRSTHNYLYRPSEELYDVINDPSESKNLAGNSSYADLISRLRDRLNTMREETEDPWLINKNYVLNKRTFPK